MSKGGRWQFEKPPLAVVVGIVLGIILLIPVLSSIREYNQSTSENSLEDSEIWTTLRLLDYKSGNAPEPLRKLNGTVVRIAGFLVPLDYGSNNELKEFLLIPSPMSCIHVPPPPPNQVVHVTMNIGTDLADFENDVVVVEGKLTLNSESTAEAMASFDLSGNSLSKF